MGSMMAGLCMLVAVRAADGRTLMVRVENPAALHRANQTIELSLKDLAPLGESNLTRLHVADDSGSPVLCQAVDTDFDPLHQPDILIFQADFKPQESRSFEVLAGPPPPLTPKQFKAYGRFVRERFDDFAWENDRIAHRTYGKALETWEGEPLSSSTIDIWSKRTPRMVINDWYMAEDYHTDHGEGADFYSAGLTRGCGGNGLWAAERLWVSRNFVDSRVLANGPIRVVFELVYEPFEVNGISVSEVKRVTLDAGQQLDRFESRYQVYARPGTQPALVCGIGLKKVRGEQLELKTERGWVAKWEGMAKNAGEQGLAVIVEPRQFIRKTDDSLNHLMLVHVASNGTVSYWAGFCWDKAGNIADFDAWKQYVEDFAAGLASPLEITVEARD